MTKPDFILLAIGTVLSLFGAVIFVDLVAASGAQPCGSGGPAADCYPWGAEGPVAGNWWYQSKTTYLLSGTRVTGLHRALVAAAFAVTIILLLV